MTRKLRKEEIDLVTRLVGPKFDEIDAIQEQLHNSSADEMAEGNIIELWPLQSRKLTTTRTLLGEGSCRDTDGIPIVFSLLQKDGYLWRLDISRVDGQRIRGPLNYAAVVALGSGQGVSLEDGRNSQEPA